MSEVDKNDLREDWKQHPYTALMVKWALAEREAALAVLRGACSVSTDPRVRASYEKLQACERHEQLLKEGMR